MSAYKYLGTVINNKLSWTPHIDACYKKAQKKMYLLRKLKMFKVEQVIMQLFYQAVIQNAIFFNLVCFFGNTKKGDFGRLEKITRTARRIMRTDPPSPSDIFQRAALRKLTGIQADTSHPLSGVVQSCAPARDSSHRLRSLKSWTTRRLNRCIPVAITLHNAALWLSTSLRARAPLCGMFGVCVYVCVCVCVCVCVTEREREGGGRGEREGWGI